MPILLTEQESQRIFSWQPYKQDWPIDRNQKEDGINDYYGDLIKKLTENNLFHCFFSEDGGLGNYLEFFCYPKNHNNGKANAIIVCISLCAPIAAYGQTSIYKTADSFGWGGLFSPNTVGIIKDPALADIEKAIIEVLKNANLSMIDQEFASRPLPEEVVDQLKNENHNEGNQYLHGIFQKID
jgi:hypothetical protein